MDNLKELAQQNGNQGAAVMVPYHESGSGEGRVVIMVDDSYLKLYSTTGILATGKVKVVDKITKVIITTPFGIRLKDDVTLERLRALSDFALVSIGLSDESVVGVGLAGELYPDGIWFLEVENVNPSSKLRFIDIFF